MCLWAFPRSLPFPSNKKDDSIRLHEFIPPCLEKEKSHDELPGKNSSVKKKKKIATKKLAPKHQTRAAIHLNRSK